MTEKQNSTKSGNITSTESKKRLLSAMNKHGNNISALSQELKMLSASMRNIPTPPSANNNTVSDTTNNEEQQNQETNDSFSAIYDFLSSSADMETESLDDILKAEAATGDYFASLQHNEEDSAEDISAQISSINSFLNAIKNGDFAKDKALSTCSTRDKEEMDLTEDEVDKTIIDETFFTESLAKIYIRQRKYNRALEIIRKLSLKYPEKNIYFADQIRFLEKLIINIKQK